MADLLNVSLQSKHQSQDQSGHSLTTSEHTRNLIRFVIKAPKQCFSQSSLSCCTQQAVLPHIYQDSGREALIGHSWRFDWRCSWRQAAAVVCCGVAAGILCQDAGQIDSKIHLSLLLLLFEMNVSSIMIPYCCCDVVFTVMWLCYCLILYVW